MDEKSVKREKRAREEKLNEKRNKRHHENKWKNILKRKESSRHQKSKKNE